MGQMYSHIGYSKAKRAKDEKNYIKSDTLSHLIEKFRSFGTKVSLS